ncbi:tetratricopeptide repeat-containing sulfotransferase family protein [Aestuariivirga litoralis]|uniref:tetratricopeptide repeat-containing sulfotransferase family protein n=1 Tax=Aestuariivirga litoralis TaxID=2650924 RepID=UPI00137A1C63|nr:tetratricopeptide repeat-containing sulfotransferase family protein [Aestuariivirga litoralis]
MNGAAASATIGRLLQAGFALQRKGELAQARALYAQVLEIDRRNFDALQLSGLCALQAGDTAAARQLLDRALALRQDVASVFNHRGVALRRLGEPERAIADFTRVITLDPQSVDARYNRANTLRELGRREEALADYRLAAERAPARADILNNLGACLKDVNLHAEALACYDRLVAISPQHAEAHSNRGLVLQNLGRFEEALASVDRAVALKPDFAEAWRERAAALLALGRLDEARESVSKAVAHAPGNAGAHATLGLVMMETGRPEDAAQSFAQALALQPGHVEARLGLAKLTAEEGRFADAEELFNAVLEDEPGNVASLHGLAGLRKFKAGDPLFAAIADRLRDGRLTAEQREQLHHGFAKICNDAGRQDDAMAHFAQSKLCRASRFDLAAHRAGFSAMQRLFTPAFFAARRDFGSEDARPVFIVGMPRSGTTLTEQILAAHPAAQGFGELQDMAALSKKLGGGLKMPEAFTQAVAALDAEASLRLAERYLAAFRGAAPGMLRVIDKRPHNYEMLGLIALLFPRAHIIHCRRDAMDNCLSMYMQDFNPHHGYNRDLTTLGHYYRAYEDLMAHWRKVLPLPIHDCIYEDTVNDLETSARALVDFVGLDWDPACLDYHARESQVRTPSQWQVRQPVYRTSVAAWRRYENHLGPLKRALGVE